MKLKSWTASTSVKRGIGAEMNYFMRFFNLIRLFPMGCKFRQNSGQNFDSPPDSRFFGAGMLRLRFRRSASFWMTHFHKSADLITSPPLQIRPNDEWFLAFALQSEADIKKVSIDLPSSWWKLTGATTPPNLWVSFQDPTHKRLEQRPEFAT
jgi:hypothetical protein